jgi:hypothetical protein
MWQKVIMIKLREASSKKFALMFFFVLENLLLCWRTLVLAFLSCIEYI